ncbi:hypothetical protein MTY414_78780 [Mycolicibacterium mageritense]|nr:hypothetical protein MTY414_78780 [Mycolicibacterium mageritense]
MDVSFGYQSYPTMLRSLESRIEAGKAASDYDIIKPIHSGQIDMPAKIKQIKGYPKAGRDGG